MKFRSIAIASGLHFWGNYAPMGKADGVVLIRCELCGCYAAEADKVHARCPGKTPTS